MCYECFPPRFPLPKNRLHDNYVDVFKICEIFYIRDRKSNRIISKHWFIWTLNKKINKLVKDGFIINRI